MMQLIFLYFMPLSFFFSSCTSKAPADKNLIGFWKSKDGAIVNIMNESSFAAKQFPTTFFYYSNLKHPNQLFDGSGKWEIVDGQTYWKFHINFLTTSIKEIRIGTTLLIGGSGLLEKSAPYKTLFLWKGEEGGERYELINKIILKALQRWRPFVLLSNPTDAG